MCLHACSMLRLISFDACVALLQVSIVVSLIELLQNHFYEVLLKISENEDA